MADWVLSAIWVGSGIVHYGGAFAYWQRQFPLIAESNRRSDMLSSFIVSLFGPIALLALVFHWAVNGRGFFRHGFKWR